MHRSGLMFEVQGNGQIPQAHRLESHWERFCRSLLDSCREMDHRILDARSLLVVFSDRDTRTAEAKGRILEQAHRSWRRAAPPVELLDFVRVREVELAPRKLPPTPVDRTLRTSATPGAGVVSGPKRAIDVIGALVAAVLAAPLMALIACGIRLTSRGPILFRQERLGQNGASFTMYKFRTMRHNADQAPHRAHMKALITGEMERDIEGCVKLNGDTRIYPFGAFLRRWSLDELPQLYNVLNGTMSLVGPRPSVHYEIEHYQDWHRERLAAKPGITGLWQVHGRGRTGFDDMARLDIRYIRTWSVQQDLKLIALTIPAALSRSGAL